MSFHETDGGVRRRGDRVAFRSLAEHDARKVHDPTQRGRDRQIDTVRPEDTEACFFLHESPPAAASCEIRAREIPSNRAKDRAWVAPADNHSRSSVAQADT